MFFKLPLRDIIHPQPFLKREGVIFPPCEGGLKVGADFNSHVSLRDSTHPSLPSFREGEFFLPAREDERWVLILIFKLSLRDSTHPQPVLKREVGIIKLLRLLSGDRMEVCRFRDMVYVKNFLFLFCL